MTTVCTVWASMIPVTVLLFHSLDIVHSACMAVRMKTTLIFQIILPLEHGKRLKQRKNYLFYIKQEQPFLFLNFEVIVMYSAFWAFLNMGSI